MGQIEKILARQKKLDAERRAVNKSLREAKKKEQGRREEILGKVLRQYLDRYPKKDMSVWVRSLLDTALTKPQERTLFDLPGKVKEVSAASQQTVNG